MNDETSLLGPGSPGSEDEDANGWSEKNNVKELSNIITNTMRDGASSLMQVLGNQRQRNASVDMEERASACAEAQQEYHNKQSKSKKKKKQKQKKKIQEEEDEEGDVEADDGPADFVFCTECGAKNDADLEQCEGCGAKIISFNEVDDDEEDDEDDDSSDDEEEYDDDDEEDGDGENGNLKGVSRRESYDPFENMSALANAATPPSVAEGSSSTTPVVTGGFPKQEEIYEVRFKPGKSGLSFDEDWMGKQLVVDDLPDEEFLAEEQSGRGWSAIHCGDFLIAINDESCMGLCLERVEAMLTAAQEAGEYRVRLRSGASLDDAFGADGSEAVEARSVIYKQKSALYEPPDHMDMVYGYILRYRGEKVISFQFFRESDNKFMCGALLPKNGKGQIIFHNSKDLKGEGDMKDVHMHSESAKYLGCMVHNFLGTMFTIHDYRVHNPTSTRKTIHHELGVVLYETNMFGRVPNSLKAVLPRWDPEQGLKGQRQSLSARYNQTTKRRLGRDLNLMQRATAKKTDEYQAVELDEQEDLLTFDTKKPSWNEELQAWTLNFNGRVKMASKKNFLLVPQAQNEAMDEEFGADTVCLRFGKVLKDRFSLDFRHPISPIQAFGIALSSFSNKLVVT